MPQGSSVAVTNYVIPGGYGSFQFSLDIDSGAYTLTALNVNTSMGHFDLSNAGGAISGGSLVVGGAPAGYSLVVRNAGPDFLLNADTTTLRGNFDGMDVTLAAMLVVNPANTVDAVYDIYGGRDPTAQERSYWQSAIASGTASLASVRNAVLTDTHGIGEYARDRIGGIYTDYLGRAPTSGEVNFWEGRLAQGDFFGSVRAAVLNSTDGSIMERDTVRALYVEYGGRTANEFEDVYWYNRVRTGADYNVVRNTILDDPLGQQHTRSALNAQYTAYFGRAPTDNEVGVWNGLLHNGATFATVTDALLSDRSSDASGVHRLAGVANKADTFDLGSKVGNVVIDGFEPARDKIDLHQAGYSGVNPLDSTHARQVIAPNGAHDVLITLDAQNHVVLHNVELAQLSAANFIA